MRVIVENHDDDCLTTQPQRPLHPHNELLMKVMMLTIMMMRVIVEDDDDDLYVC